MFIFKKLVIKMQSNQFLEELSNIFLQAPNCNQYYLYKHFLIRNLFDKIKGYNLEIRNEIIEYLRYKIDKLSSDSSNHQFLLVNNNKFAKDFFIKDKEGILDKLELLNKNQIQKSDWVNPNSLLRQGNHHLLHNEYHKIYIPIHDSICLINDANNRIVPNLNKLVSSMTVHDVPNFLVENIKLINLYKKVIKNEAGIYGADDHIWQCSSAIEESRNNCLKILKMFDYSSYYSNFSINFNGNLVEYRSDFFEELGQLETKAMRENEIGSHQKIKNFFNLYRHVANIDPSSHVEKSRSSGLHNSRSSSKAPNYV
jgi:hypothetical protein